MAGPKRACALTGKRKNSDGSTSGRTYLKGSYVMKELQGKVAIVTGAGLAKGMGSAAARELAKQGANVVVTDLEANLDGLEKLVKEIELLGSKGLAVKVDVTNPQDIEACVSKT